MTPSLGPLQQVADSLDCSAALRIPRKPDAQATPAAQRPAAGPALSLVLISEADAALLCIALRGCVPLCARHDVQVVVARRGGTDDGAALQKQFPSVRFCYSPPSATIKSLRGFGMAHASGDVVMIADARERGLCERLSHLVRSHGS